MELISPHPLTSIARPFMLQTWRSLTFLHWPYQPSIIQRLLPEGLTLDTFDGLAWVGLVPFLLDDLRTSRTRALPWISRFPETNVRTYVTGPDGRPGVWFFTLDASRLAAVIGARVLYRLPYRWARMRVDEQDGVVRYQSRRLLPFDGARSLIEIQPGRQLQPSQFDTFLTARFRLYTVAAGQIASADIEHEPWPLRRAEVLQLEQNLFEKSGVPQPAGQPVVHFAPHLDVRVGRFRRTA